MPDVLACCINAPEAYIPKAQYALEMLLLPLEVEPRWVTPGALAAEPAGLYYGPAEATVGEDILKLPLYPSTADYFSKRTAYPVEHVQWTEEGGRQIPALFPLENEGASRINTFDLVASTFFWLSGWQEHTIKRRDRHGRFPYTASLQHAWDIVDQPVVDQYRNLLADMLRQLGVSVTRRHWGGRDWALCPTHDIDYLKKWRPGIIYRELVTHFLSNRLRQPLGKRWDRLSTGYKELLSGRDSYRQSFERIQQEEEKRGVGATFFIKTGAHGPQDVYYSPSNRYLKQRIKALQASAFEIGLHPSYHAATHAGYMSEERRRLQQFTDQRIRSVRQHYLRYQAPLTGRLHIGNGFQLDSSMGFAEHEGFRRGTCMPFQMFDIAANRPLDLWQLPLVVMDSTLFGYRNLTVDEALVRTKQLMQTCKQYGGACVALWHNIIYDPIDGHGFDIHFEATLDRALEEGAFVGGISAAFDQWMR